MKKTLLILFVVLLTAGTSQIAKAQLVQFGIKGGYNAANLPGLKDTGFYTDVSGLSAWHAGALVQFNIPIVTIQADVLYSVQGANATDALGAETKIENAYINIPAVAKLKILSILNIQAGLQYGILLSSKVNGETKNQITQENYKDQIKNGDWAIPVGIGLQVSKLLVDLRYNIGVADINDISVSDTNINNGVFQASVGVVF